MAACCVSWPLVYVAANPRTFVLPGKDDLSKGADHTRTFIRANTPPGALLVDIDLTHPFLLANDLHLMA